MKIDISLQNKPDSKKWNELYYLLECNVVIRYNDGSIILKEDDVPVVEMKHLLDKWYKTDFIRKIEFRYEPDSYLNNPMLLIFHLKHSWIMIGSTGGGHSKVVVDDQDISDLIHEFRERLKVIIESF